MVRRLRADGEDVSVEDDPAGADQWEDYDSGPYCEHWAEPWECDEKCACGHECKEHPSWEDGCRVEGCACKEWKKPPLLP